MSQPELLKRVVQVLDETGIPYMLTGSMASSLQGEPRSTHDIDLVVSIPPAAAKSLAAAFPQPAFYLDDASITEAIATGGMFNLLDVTEGDKVDFWMLTSEPFDASRFARRLRVEVMGAAVAVSTPEDTILAKLKWARLSGGSEKQLTDAIRVYEVQLKGIDQSYLDRWAQELGVKDLLARVRAEAKP